MRQEEQSPPEHNHELLSQHFKEQEEVMQKIYRTGARSYFESLPDLVKAFSPHDRWIRCIDDRTPGGYHSAGSGILRKEEEVLASFRAAQVQGITSHDGCGAAAMYAQKNSLTSNPDEYGKRWSEQIAGKLGVPYKHIEISKPHNARICYYDGTRRFNFSNVDSLLPGFIVSRRIQDSATSINEAEITANIALGDHGFGKLITEDRPFVVVAIGQSEKELEEFKKELTPTLSNFGNKVKIDGFVAPK